MNEDTQQTSYRTEFNMEMRRAGESWADVVACTLTEKELEDLFDLSAVDPFPKFRGETPYLWTKERVYFLMQDGDYSWIESVPRNPPPEKPAQIQSELEREIFRVVEQAASQLWSDAKWLEWAKNWMTDMPHPQARSVETCYLEKVRLLTWRMHTPDRVPNDQEMFKWWVVRCATSAAHANALGNETNARKFISGADYWARYIKS